MNGMLTISELLCAFVQENSEEAFTEFLRQQADLLFRVIKKSLYNPSDAEDVLQTVFIIIFTKAKEIKNLDQLNDGQIKGWCITIARNAANMQNRKEGRRRIRETIYSEKIYSNKECSENVEVAINSNELNENKIKEIGFAIDGLHEKYRIPIHLHYVENIELIQVAKILALNPNTLRTRIRRGLIKLSEVLSQKNIVAPIALLITLLPTIPVEAASKKMVDRNIDDVLSYHRNLMLSNKSLGFSTLRIAFYLKALLTATVLGLFGFGIFYSFYNFTIVPDNKLTKSLKHFEWDFSKDKAEELTFLKDYRINTSKTQYLSFEEDKVQFILIPFKKDENDVVIEAELLPKKIVGKKASNNDKPSGLVFDAFVYNNERNFLTKSFYRKFYSFNIESKVKSKMYLSSDWNYNTTNGQLTDITQFKNNDKGFILIVLQNFDLYKLSIKEEMITSDKIKNLAVNSIAKNPGKEHISFVNNKVLALPDNR